MSNAHPILANGGPSAQSVYDVSTTPMHMVGTTGTLEDGRTFEYVKSNDGTAIPKGNLATYDPVVAAVDKIAVQAAAGIGDTSVSVTVTLTAAANELAGGWLSIDDDAGEAEMYRILANPSHTSGTLTLTIDRGLVVAITTSTTATIVLGPSSVKKSAAVVAQADAVEAAAGVPLVTIPDGSTTAQYAWVQKTGLCNVLFGAVVGAVGQPIYNGEAAGSFQAAVANTSGSSETQMPQLGQIVALLPVDTEYHTVRLNVG